ncbi:hypothetical protein E2C01_070038 [Portunus trituberculatus]|uniref:Uncharacterized protein n=1 Tax=Portunus trituberculatus TaxID=210409 RepID=A0A5B7I0I5_PORTR|nr:hypothetical protein [Portunus trituberculatus]
MDTHQPITLQNEYGGRGELLSELLNVKEEEEEEEEEEGWGRVYADLKGIGVGRWVGGWVGMWVGTN